MARERGFTLVELMTAVALTAVLTGAIAGLLRHARIEATTAGRHAEQLGGFRKAVAALSADLRAARAVTIAANELAIATPDTDVVWRCRDGVLTRGVGPRTATVARAVSGMTTVHDGALWRVTLHVGRGTELPIAILPRTEAAR